MVSGDGLRLQAVADDPLSLLYLRAFFIKQDVHQSWQERLVSVRACAMPPVVHPRVS